MPDHRNHVPVTTVELSAQERMADALEPLVHTIPWPAFDTQEAHERHGREWLVTNGLGGYASGSVAGAITRRYHALLVAALPAPLGRVAMLSHLSERLRFASRPADRAVVWLGVHSRDGRLAQLDGAEHLVAFRLESGLPIWRYDVGGILIEKALLLVHGQNTLHVRYTRIDTGASDAEEPPIRIGLRPLLNFRPHDAPVNRAIGHYTVTAVPDGGARIDITADGESQMPALRLGMNGANSAFTMDRLHVDEVGFALEAQRGYDSEGALWSPGYFRADLTADAPVTLVASVEPWSVIDALSANDAWRSERERRARLLTQAHPEARTGVAASLALAADQFIIAPAGRTEDAARARALGEDARTVIAGYHWFTDWGRDTMISLEGLTLVTGRHREARDILHTFAHHVRDGLIPNLFPEHGEEGLYHTADATLWFFHAVDRYLAWTNDTPMLALLLPTLHDIVDHHLRGTRFSIHVDPADGLLHQGAPGYQLTWMDAKVSDWVVTPRRGKAVEINALWYNALRLLEDWTRAAGDEARAAELAAHAGRAREAFNRRFWNDATGCLYDVVDSEPDPGDPAVRIAHADSPQADSPQADAEQTDTTHSPAALTQTAHTGAIGDGHVRFDDDACRPNQVLALALRHPVLDENRWAAVLTTVRDRLLTPVGLRSLAPGHPDYKARYFGDLRARDAAYHQGTVWAWLIGPFVDAWLTAHPTDVAGARACLQGFVPHLDQACIGSISEIFDAEAPFTPRGCIAQAWSVAEVLRAWIKTSSSSAAGTTDWSAPPISPGPAGA